MARHVLRPWLHGWQLRIAELSPTSPTLRYEAYLRPDFIERALGADFEEILMRLYATQRSVLDQHGMHLEALKLSRSRQNRFPGYELADFRTPFKDRRILEFCLAAPIEARIHAGRDRGLFRQAMRGLVPNEILERSCKLPFAPDYHLRYNRDRPRVRAMIEQLPTHDAVREIVDIPVLERAARAPASGPHIRTQQDFAALIAVPKTTYLLRGLQRVMNYDMNLPSTQTTENAEHGQVKQDHDNHARER